MSFTATVENDTIRLPPGVHLADGTEVTIEPATATPHEPPRTTLAERLAPFIGSINTGLGDLAENHDHYLYRTPKGEKVKPVFAHAWFYLAILDAGDQHHTRASAWLRTFDGAIVTTRWILLEVVNSLSAPAFRRQVSALLDSLETDPGVMIVGDSDRLFDQGRALYDRRPDKHWSLTDCISFAVMEQEGLSEALTGDRHFAQAGFVAMFAD